MVKNCVKTTKNHQNWANNGPKVIRNSSIVEKEAENCVKMGQNGRKREFLAGSNAFLSVCEGRDASPRRPRCAAAQRERGCLGSFRRRRCLSANAHLFRPFVLCPVPQAGTGHGRLGDAFLPARTGRTGTYPWR